jgi:hypothetical protein
MRSRGIALLSIVLAGLGLVLFLWNGSEPASLNEPRLIAWSVDFETVSRIAIELPWQGKGQAWVKSDDGGWYFEGQNGKKVDDQRWGGGIPLLVSGAKAQRLIVERATEADLEVYGLAEPQMTVRLTIDSAEPVDIDVGAPTPDGSAYYLRLAGSPTVFAIHHTWRDVLAQLVLDPPIPP